MPHALVLGLLAGLGIALPLGAIGVLLLAEGMQHGWRPAASGALGVALVDAGYAVLAVLAGAAVTAALDGRERTVRVLGAGVLTLIAGRGLLALRRPAAAVPADLGGTERRPLACLGRFVALTAINPMTAIYFTVLAAGLSATSGLDLTRPAQATAFVAGIGLGSLSWQVVLATIGAVAGIRLSPSVRTGIGAVGYAIVLGYAVLLLVT